MRRNLIALGCGLLGAALALGLGHLWADHQLVDSIRAAREQQIAAQAQQIEQFRQQQKQAGP